MKYSKSSGIYGLSISELETMFRAFNPCRIAIRKKKHQSYIVHNGQEKLNATLRSHLVTLTDVFRRTITSLHDA